MRQRPALASLFVALLVALAGTLPLLLRGPSCGHDFDFHLQSWLATAAAWHAGIVSPRWLPGANYGAGEPRFIFYPPASWLLGAGLGLLLPWTLVPAAFAALCFAGAGAAMHQLGRRFLSLPGAALAAALYALSPYLLFTAFERSASGELLAAVPMPLLVEALLLPRLPVVRTALLLAALWFTNAPAAVMGCYLLLFATLYRTAAAGLELWGRGKRKARAHPPPGSALLGSALLRGGAALVLGCTLAADYLLPAWYEQRFVAIDRAVGAGMRVDDSFLFGHTGEPFHDAVLHSASWLAVVTLGVGAAAGGLLLLRKAPAPGNGPSVRVPDQPRDAVPFLTLLLAVCFVLQLHVSRGLWHTLPELGFLQFPWRLLLPASVAAALLAARVLFPRPGARAHLPVLALAVLYGAGAASWAARTRFQPCDDEDKVSAQLQLLRDGRGFEGTDEYAPRGSDNGEIQPGLPPVRLLRAPDGDEGDDSHEDDSGENPGWRPQPETAVPGAVYVRFWAAAALEVAVHPARDAFAVLRLERFPAWEIRLNGLPCGQACVPRDDGLVTVHVPGNRWSTIQATDGPTADILWGRTLSLGALFLLCLRRAPAVARARSAMMWWNER